ncbi:hypothetical protein [Paenibacillus sp. PL91]|uniref:hypothetical protein n=1 Tax=Paenibacillus sp. PL91 TaxID=2729538 RepID=UPI00145CB401|nr:hypothetical protein [Paenibacillus sp. PL91]MBC9204173.1 hypothetical protein [Paenibacillus sp. PL91]
MPIEKIDNLFEKMVDKYRFDKNHKFEFQAKGSDKIESIATKSTSPNYRKKINAARCSSRQGEISPITTTCSIYLTSTAELI